MLVSSEVVETDVTLRMRVDSHDDTTPSLTEGSVVVDYREKADQNGASVAVITIKAHFGKATKAEKDSSDVVPLIGNCDVNSALVLEDVLEVSQEDRPFYRSVYDEGI